MTKVKKDPTATGKGFLERLAAHIPEDKRAGVLETLGASDALVTALGEGVLAQDDYSRSMDELRAVRAEAEALQVKATADLVARQQWYARELGHLSNYSKLINEGYVDQATGQLTAKGKAAAAAEGVDVDGEKIDLSGYIRADQLPQLLQQHVGSVASNLATYATALPFLMARHAQEFGGEILDPQALNKFCLERGLDLTTGYEGLVAGKRAEALATKHKAEVAAAVDAAKKEAREATLTELRTQLPYPVPGAAVEMGTLDVPRSTPAAGGTVDPFTPAAAAAAYLTALQAGGARAS